MSIARTRVGLPDATTGSGALWPGRDRIVPIEPLWESTAAHRDSSGSALRPSLGREALLARLSATHISGCPAGSGRLRIVATRTDPASTRNYLGLELLALPPPRGLHQH